MKKCSPDFRLPIILAIAHLLLYFTYQNNDVFWYIYTAAILYLISMAIIHEKMDDFLPFSKYILWGLLSGIFLYGIFWTGRMLLGFGFSELVADVKSLYRHYSPLMIWHYLVLILIIIPGEEVFWRGFVQKRLTRYFSQKLSIVLSALMYAFPMIYAENTVLVIAGITGGLMWGWLYAWKKSLPAVIVSHIVFDFLLLEFLPLG
ncbi:CPBP family intramembrane metalloprotease [Peribacillus saganii]|uniref:CPBP family intramembrane metalloprotease n=1 Tax=Peribacillus saganii TaxID=2303992 RepID=A0A372LU11_9BACI|nr:type II CAAX endopeptidase family protein [Peribacillus saganii]RFU71044.1 CPBP family intramembrane metalloprotease [Peribacillus saganii]